MTDTEYDPSKDGYLSYYAAIEAKRARGDKHWPGYARIELPFPVPLHALFVKHKGGGGIPSSRYKSYGREAWAAIAQQKPGKLKGEVSVFARLVAPDKRARDADNLGKCLLDTLKTNGIIEDDSNRYVKRLTYEWAADGPPCVVLIQKYEGGAA